MGAGSLDDTHDRCDNPTRANIAAKTRQLSTGRRAWNIGRVRSHGVMVLDGLVALPCRGHPKPDRGRRGDRASHPRGPGCGQCPSSEPGFVGATEREEDVADQRAALLV